MSKSDNKDNGKPSLARRGAIPASASRPVATPIFPSVVYAAESADTLDAQYEGALEGYTYAREGHPNADMLAATVDRLEGAEGGIVGGQLLKQVRENLQLPCRRRVLS